MRPSGRQASLQDGWYMKNGEKAQQLMSFPVDHSEFPGQLKGMKQVLEWGLWKNGLVMQCKKAKDGSEGRCKSAATDCCAQNILDLQPNFQKQQSLVQEVIEAAGHLCIFLPKFHCELNFIEFFWGAVKKYLWTHCDYTFTTLQENMPKALKSIPIGTIQKWEHRMIRWMEAYQSGLGAKEAQIHVKEFSSQCYTSHRQIPESVATQFDT